MLKAAPRLSKRAWLLLPIKIQTDLHSIDCQVLNLSEAGLLMSLPKMFPIAAGESFKMALSLFPGLGPCQAQGKLIWKNTQQAGVKIVSIEEKEKLILKRIIEYQLK